MTRGNGIWNINYEFIRCNSLPPIQYKSESNNPYYFKIHIINAPVPIVSLSIYSYQCIKTFDNYWVYYNPIDFGSNIFNYPLPVTLKFQDGSYKSGMIYNNYYYTILYNI